MNNSLSCFSVLPNDELETIQGVALTLLHARCRAVFLFTSCSDKSGFPVLTSTSGTQEEKKLIVRGKQPPKKTTNSSGLY